MIFREAQLGDIEQIQIVRNAVKENMLSNSALVSDADVKEFLLVRGKGWVGEINKVVVGFAIVDLKEHNVWALFVRPQHAQKGIGKALHQLMMDWYFEQTNTTIWLGTSPGTRAEKFYTLMGWKPAGNHGNKEVKFEMSFENYNACRVGGSIIV